MTNAINLLVPVILVGYMIVIGFRIYLKRKLAKDQRDYQAVIEQKMAELEQDIHARSKNLQESIQMINQEYTKLMRSMSLEQRKQAENIMQSMREQQQAPPSSSQSSKTSDSDRS